MSQQNDFTEPIQQAAFIQILELIRKQDDLIHSWVKYFLWTQSGLGIAFAFFLKLPAQDSVIPTEIGGLFLSLLGITTAYCLTNIIIREHGWQGRYIVKLRKLRKFPPIYDEDPDPNKRGYIGTQFHYLRWVVIAAWAVAGIFLAKPLLCQLFSVACPPLGG